MPKSRLISGQKQTLIAENTYVVSAPTLERAITRLNTAQSLAQDRNRPISTTNIEFIAEWANKSEPSSHIVAVLDPNDLVDNENYIRVPGNADTTPMSVPDEAAKT